MRICGPQSKYFKSDIERLIEGTLPADWEWVASSKKTQVARRCNPLVYYKKFLSRSRFEALKNVVKGSRGKRARIKGDILISHGFNAPVPLCWGDDNNHNFILFEGIEAEPIGGYIYSNWGQKLNGDVRKLKYLVISALAAEVGRMHNAGIVHGDLRLNNILLNMAKDGAPSFYFLDNERNEQYSVVPEKLIAKNLLQLNLISPKLITFSDRFRFFHYYNRVYTRFDVQAQKYLVKRIWQLTLKRFARPSLNDCYQDLQAIVKS